MPPDFPLSKALQTSRDSAGSGFIVELGEDPDHFAGLRNAGEGAPRLLFRGSSRLYWGRRPTSSRIWCSFGNHILTVKMKAGYSGSEVVVGASMDEPKTDLIQGTLDMLILKALSLEPMHGFGIARRIEQVSRGVFKVNPGSLLTAFQRLERVGWLDSEWRQTDKSRRAKFYWLTRSGRKQLEVETASWNRRVSAIAR